MTVSTVVKVVAVVGSVGVAGLGLWKAKRYVLKVNEEGRDLWAKALEIAGGDAEVAMENLNRKIEQSIESGEALTPREYALLFTAINTGFQSAVEFEVPEFEVPVPDINLVTPELQASMDRMVQRNRDICESM